MFARPIAAVAACASLILLEACLHLKPPRSIVGVVREGTGRPIGGATVWAEHRASPQDSSPWTPLDSAHHTNSIGTFGVSISKKDACCMRCTPIVRLRVKDEAHAIDDAIMLRGYNAYYDLRYGPAPERSFKVADMHYHVSMRAQNHFGQELHANSKLDSINPTIPEDILWYQSFLKLMVYDTVEGEWEKAPKMDWCHMQRPTGDNAHGGGMLERRRHYQALIAGDHLRPANANNRIDQYSQATLPHTRDGNVWLGFNAISPFEQNLNTVPQVRFTSMLIKSGASLKWLRRLGKQDAPDLMTHWENFNYEHSMMAKQDTLSRGFRWRYLRDGSQLDTGRVQMPTIVTVIEGGHLFQHQLFPNRIDFDIAHRDTVQRDGIMRRWMRQYTDTVRPMGPEAKAFLQERWSRDSVLHALEKEMRIAPSDAVKLRRQALHDLLDSTDDQLVDDALIGELRRNIDAVRAPDFFPPVHMVTVAHLSYNGMMGHAPALDDGGPAGKLLARKVYDIRVSEDPTYLKQWKGIFFAVPGVNRFGRFVMKHLLDSTGYGRRVFLDLKHSDPSTRRYFFDSLMVVHDPEGLPIDTIPPICSHCACTGMSVDLWSSFNDEYSILNAPFTRTLYPFSINIFDEEIVTMHRHGGIIGLPLEHRVLGGYIDKRQNWNYVVDRRGHYDGPHGRYKRWNHNRWMLRHFLEPDDTIAKVPKAMIHWHRLGHDTLHAVLDTTMKDLNIDQDAAMELIEADYVSAEPFLQNLFHMIDLIMDDAGSKHCPLDTFNLSHPWRHICLGSDLDGLIDPIDICPTASEYPYFHDRLKQFIPIFLIMRRMEAKPHPSPEDRGIRDYDDYFNGRFTIDDALGYLFYESLKEFTRWNFRTHRP